MEKLIAKYYSSWSFIGFVPYIDMITLQVLDEIHRQPGSLSLSVVSVPALESVVNSLPSKIHKKLDTALSKNDVEQ